MNGPCTVNKLGLHEQDRDRAQESEKVHSTTCSDDLAVNIAYFALRYSVLAFAF